MEGTAKAVKDVSPHDFVKAYASHLKRSGKKKSGEPFNKEDKDAYLEAAGGINKDGIVIQLEEQLKATQQEFKEYKESIDEELKGIQKMMLDLKSEVDRMSQPK